MTTVFFLMLAFISGTLGDDGNNSSIVSSEATTTGSTHVTHRNVSYGLHIDEHGCVYKVLQSGNSLYTVSCFTWCLHRQFYKLPNFMPCLQVAKDFAERSLQGSEPTQCLIGACINGMCRTSYRRVTCQVPKARMHCWDNYGNYHVMRR
uniref:Evasin n=1 Tax=Rhipicephalus appendiculatus TaxID=34631 RepID=A0A131Z5D0_RHIAP